MRMSQLREKEVINICDGERLGNVCDVDFEKKTGRICSLILRVPARCLHIGERSGIYCSLRADQTDRHGCDPCGGGTGKVPAEMSVGRVK